MMTEPVPEGRHRASIRRITGAGKLWRVMVETWQESDAYHGRLLFHRESERLDGARASAPLLRGRSRTDVLALAHDVSEERLRQVLHSLG
ncbi:MAG TPA: hypothetical protein VK912_03685 [Longimicrobiales bacterium]|nr:hypothetical protein [Longimicrobiales bacterium]